MTGRREERWGDRPERPSAPQFSACAAPVRAMLGDVERILSEQAASATPPLDAILRHALAGGKRMRPTMILLVGSLLSGDPQRLTQIAAAVETLHVATLIHDDIVDHSPVRRGREAVHVRWSVQDGVLAGDSLLAAAAGRIASLGDTALMKVFADVLSTVCIGQITEAHRESGKRRRRDTYLQDIEAKTASLIAGACEMAAMAANASPDIVERAREFGRQIGIGFQIADDVLDFVGEEPLLGKPRGSDLRQGLLTLPALLYLEQGAADDDALQGIIAGSDRSARAIASAIELIRCSGAIDAALDEARQHARKALSILDEWIADPRTRGSAGVEDALRSLVFCTVSRGR